MTSEAWESLVGQPEAARRLSAAVSSPVHAYLFVGPGGVGKRQAARIFAGELLADADPDRASHHRGLAQQSTHADIVVFAPAGNNLRLGSRTDPGEIPAIISEATRSPTEATRKVVIVEDFQSADAPASSALLKLVEEPPQTTIFVLLADDVPPHQATIESRCLRIDFLPVSAEVIAGVLVSEELIDAQGAQVVAAAANGSVERARLLVLDERLALRRDAWWSIPDRLNGTGSVVAEAVEELRGLIDDASAVKVAQHQRELDELNRSEEQLGTRGSGRRTLETRQRRELRQFRTEELRFGFATLAARYREMVVASVGGEVAFEAIDHLNHSTDALIRNPKEALLLQALLLKLSPVDQPIFGR